MQQTVTIKQKSSNRIFILLFKVQNRLVANLSVVKKEILFIYTLFFATSIIFISIFNKYDLHLKINRLHSSFFDLFFKYSTFLGDGAIFGVLAVVFLFIKRKMFFVFVVSGVLTLLITHLFKKILFKGILRPAAALNDESLHLVDGVKMAMLNSFPSGHTTTAFAIFTILCLYFAKCKSQYLWVSLAIVAGLSRVYLSQHFLIDIFFGSFIGIIIGIVSMSIFCKANKVS
ncbi:phosphatase PAP2 family protein [Polaribacter vadi]|uniref:phosphatase PAP2 family protein n=1 Tax=Polaribacter TaxID=52959 RepID=UPI001C088008|nr:MULTISPECIES: phosphatase PAP2 family protein [Polaribacter]MBU3010071.1 phosphatase PAP2 family protein [Polaribacter vadi]MDO6739878.1 phosphatase PAP2 family protein [Polaribacter sp. 1_MG-2023]